MNTLTFEITPSLASNDHQVRIQIDGTDWLGSKYLGIDPPLFFAQTSLLAGGELLVGRCECGCEGCDDIRVVVLRDDHEVLWTNAKGLRLHFNKAKYDNLIVSAGVDYSWEDAGRTAERFVSGVFAGVSLDGGYTFDWASARVRVGIMTLSFSSNCAQKLFEIGWDGRSPQSALTSARRFCNERVEAEQ